MPRRKIVTALAALACLCGSARAETYYQWTDGSVYGSAIAVADKLSTFTAKGARNINFAIPAEDSWK